jgi:hypothetical protein
LRAATNSSTFTRAFTRLFSTFCISVRGGLPRRLTRGLFGAVCIIDRAVGARGRFLNYSLAAIAVVIEEEGKERDKNTTSRNISYNKGGALLLLLLLIYLKPTYAKPISCVTYSIVGN